MKISHPASDRAAALFHGVLVCWYVVGLWFHLVSAWRHWRASAVLLVLVLAGCATPTYVCTMGTAKMEGGGTEQVLVCQPYRGGE